MLGIPPWPSSGACTYTRTRPITLYGAHVTRISSKTRTNLGNIFSVLRSLQGLSSFFSLITLGGRTVLLRKERAKGFSLVLDQLSPAGNAVLWPSSGLGEATNLGRRRWVVGSRASAQFRPHFLQSHLLLPRLLSRFPGYLDDEQTNERRRRRRKDLLYPAYAAFSSSMRMRQGKKLVSLEASFGFASPLGEPK